MSVSPGHLSCPERVDRSDALGLWGTRESRATLFQIPEKADCWTRLVDHVCRGLDVGRPDTWASAVWACAPQRRLTCESVVGESGTSLAVDRDGTPHQATCPNAERFRRRKDETEAPRPDDP
jgi:hypothetical protein